MSRRFGRDVYHPLKFNEYSASNSRLNRHMKNIDNLRNKFIAMNNAKPIIVTGKKRTFTVKPLNNPYINKHDYYINTSQRQKIKSANTMRIPRKRYDSRERKRKPRTRKAPKKSNKSKKSI